MVIEDPFMLSQSSLCYLLFSRLHDFRECTDLRTRFLSTRVRIGILVDRGVLMSISWDDLALGFHCCSYRQMGGAIAGILWTMSCLS